MASIAKLAVILSAVTKPLEDGLKVAQAKTASFQKSFGHSFKEGVGLGAGVMGLDKLEMAMKKAIKTMPELEEAADKAEIAFGRILLKATMLDKLIPVMATHLGGLADRLEGGFVTQEFKEAGIAIWESIKNLSVERGFQMAQESRHEFVLAKLQENRLKKNIELEQRRLEGVKLFQGLMRSGTDEQTKLREDMESKIESMKTDKEKLEAARALAPGSTEMIRIDRAEQILKRMEQENKLLEQQKKLKKEEWDMFLEAEALRESLLTPAAKMGIEQEKYNRLLKEGLLTLEEYWAATEKLVDKMEEVKKIEEETSFGDADYESRSAQFAGADQAGSAAAYSALVNAQGGMRSSDQLEVAKRHVGVSQDVLKLTRELVKQQGDALEALQASHTPKVITFGGV